MFCCTLRKLARAKQYKAHLFQFSYGLYNLLYTKQMWIISGWCEEETENNVKPHKEDMKED